MYKLDADIYRLLQEQFVSNHNGTTWQEVIFTLLPNVCGILLTTTTLGVLRGYINKNVEVIIEFLLIVVSNILCCTILSEYIGIVCITMICISVVNVNVFRIKHTHTFVLNTATDKKPLITNFRALTNIITAICILAVDFQIFPRKFIKTEKFGYSLMDTGVGLFIVANALVAPEARNILYHQRGFLRNIKNCFRSCIPLLVLGLGRFAVVEYMMGYQKHITEYGIHWNFFLTLAIVKLFTNIIASTIGSKYSLPLGFSILGMHEYIMSTKDLEMWVLGDSPRDNFFSANREGLVSIPGYIGLYFLGVTIGRLIHSTRQTKISHICFIPINHTFRETFFLCNKLIFIFIQACIATLICTLYSKVSRRLANAAYCIWILTLTIILLLLLLLVQIILDIINDKANKTHKINSNIKSETKKSELENDREGNKKLQYNIVTSTLEIFNAVNYNSLVFFLFSNFLTGLVNTLIYTLDTTKLVAALILIIYMAINIFSIVILYGLQIPLKL